VLPRRFRVLARRQMRLVPDNNQIAPLLANYHHLSVAPDGITLSTDILAEIVHPPTFDSKTRITTLVALPVRLAIQMQQLVEDVRDFQPDQLQRVVPFAAAGSEWERGAASLLRELADPSRSVRPGIQKWAENVKHQNRRFTANLALSRAAQRVREEILRRSGGKTNYPRVGSLDEALRSSIATGAGSDLGSIVLHSIYGSKADSMPRPEAEARYAAIMANPYLGRFYRMVFCYILSYSRMWDEGRKHLNFEPAEHLDDWTDIVLPMFAEPGDIIISADRKLRAALEVVEPAGAVVCRSVDELKVPTSPLH
jgi:hypothetical protein